MAGSPPRPVELRDCREALLLVVKCAINSRAQKGENLFRAAHLSKHAIDLNIIKRFIPKPMLSNFTPSQYGRVYTSALHYVDTPFDSIETRLSIDKTVDYLSTRSSYAHSALVMSCIYIDRFISYNPQVFVSKSNVENLFVTAYMIAVKFLEKRPISLPASWSAHTETPEEHFCFLEILFRHGMQHELFVSREEFKKAEIMLMTEAMGSDRCEDVHSCLQRNNIRSFHIACRRARAYFKEVYSRKGCKRRDEKHMPYQKQEREYDMGSIIKELAKAQIKHDFHLQKQHSGEDIHMSLLTCTDRKRYQKLKSIIRGSQHENHKLEPLEMYAGVEDGSWRVAKWRFSCDMRTCFIQEGVISYSNRWAAYLKDRSIQNVRLRYGCYDEATIEKVLAIMIQFKEM